MATLPEAKIEQWLIEYTDQTAMIIPMYREYRMVIRITLKNYL